MTTGSSDAGYRTVRIGPADWAQLRELRLQMLQDTPTAYLETYEQALAVPEEEWRARAVRAALPHCFAVAMVAPDGTWVGHMGSREVVPGLVMLVGVWVHPEHRGPRGAVADRLLDAVFDWARTEVKAERICLDVHESGARAAAFYRRRGFRTTGSTRPYPLDPATLEIEMIRTLSDPPGA